MSKFHFKIDKELVLRQGLSQELTLIMAFIEQQNYQLKSYITNFSEKLIFGGDGIKINEYNDLVSVSNISSDHYDLESTFKEELPNYICKTQLLMLWVMLEDTLRYIVKELEKRKGSNFREQNSKEPIFIYLIKLLDNIDKSKLQHQQCVKFLNENVRKVRNSIVHGSNPNVVHDGIKITEFGVLVSPTYITEVFMAINDLANSI